MPGHEGKIETRCPACNVKYHVPASSVGRHVRCVKCQTTFQIAQNGHQQTLPGARRAPTEDDILRWLSEGAEEESVAPRPRIISGSDPSRPESHEDTNASEPAVASAGLPAPHPTTVVDPGPLSTGKGLRKTG